MSEVFVFLLHYARMSDFASVMIFVSIASTSRISSAVYSGLVRIDSSCTEIFVKYSLACPIDWRACVFHQLRVFAVLSLSEEERRDIKRKVKNCNKRRIRHRYLYL